MSLSSRVESAQGNYQPLHVTQKSTFAYQVTAVALAALAIGVTLWASLFYLGHMSSVVSIGIGTSATVAIIATYAVYKLLKKTEAPPAVAVAEAPNPPAPPAGLPPVYSASFQPHIPPPHPEERVESVASQISPLSIIPLRPLDASSPLIGMTEETRRMLRQLQLSISVTPGVNKRGSSESDQAFVNARIQDIREKIGPHAHTRDSFNQFLGLLRRPSALIGEPKEGVEHLLSSHRMYKARMIERFGHQLTVSVIGAGPMGLSAAIMYYELGYKVNVCEKRLSEEGPNSYLNRSQPFSFIRYSYWFLHHLGVSSADLIDAFGYQVPPEGMPAVGLNAYGMRFQILQGGHYSGVGDPLMQRAKREIIGERAAAYVPQYMGLPIKTTQHLLAESLHKIQGEGSEEMNITFGADCHITADENGKKTITFRRGDEEVRHTPDLIYNASGGKLNEQLGFRSHSIGTYYGAGAFFPRPVEKLPEQPQVLSRAIRVFCSYNAATPIYCNVELSAEEFENEALRNQVIHQVAGDVGLPEALDAFKVKIDLRHVEEAARSSGDQMILCGGDSLLQPHFITASGANLGILGLIQARTLTKQWLDGEIEQDAILSQYNIIGSVLQKQSAQVILELFGRNLV